ncbi:MAG TPA: class I SAM-dependent methyltransferase, partial [Rhabdochlamydiaceae bacterium]|nr:class I SAM-dependent methyltransferase [Rhabdochlamydiaceae bacterium]
MYEKIVKAHTRLFSDYCEKYQRRTEQGHTAYLLPFIQSFLREIKGKRILDLGCGPGRDLAYFKEQSYEAVGLDCSPGMIKLCQEKGLHTICADFLSIPFDNESFNGIWAYTSLTLVPEEIFKQVLEKIK